MIDKLKALGDENRYWIIRLLLEKKHCVRALSTKIGISEPAVSQHLKILKACGLVTGQKSGYYMHYHVNKEALEDVIEEISLLLTIEPSDEIMNKKCCHGGEK
ncbi:winged helix-turn-helix transcriptional regulator [Acidaminobacter sp. JC074]|uniref:ArsR/SmtB family transcription factor n=1 Tax=Acidaminobacter sp. JC074 TaxID=2530199 RepID=UPI001F104CBE|nr:metalloregulator ArsR/SmtB family transcription factor [Acidaminobacter sp. JC074]MCH4888144.1 winged helix-turn-helix transcriptional regulator [Acidaminobacter sp. JC074]